MKRLKKKPSNRGKKANQKSLHCSSAVSKRSSHKVKEWTKWMNDITSFIKSISKGFVAAKVVYDQTKPYLKLVWEWIFG